MKTVTIAGAMGGTSRKTVFAALSRFDEASNHPYECKCELCKEWWASVPPEEDEDE